MGVAELVLPYAVLAALWLPTVTAQHSPSAPAQDPQRRVSRALDAVVGEETHVVLEDDDGEPRPLRTVIDRLAGEVLRDVGAVLPVPGRAAGVPTVALLDAVEAEQCLLLRTEGGSWAAVPQAESFGSELEPGTLVRWRLFRFPFAERPVATLLGQLGTARQARQQVAEALTTAQQTFAELDLLPATGSDLALEVLRSETPAGLLPPGLEPARVELVTRCARLLALSEVAQQAEAPTAAQQQARDRALAGLQEVARAGLAAATVQHPTRS